MPASRSFAFNQTVSRCLVKDAKNAVPIDAMDAKAFKGLKKSDKAAHGWCEQTGFKGSAGQIALLPDGNGKLARVLFGLGDDPAPFLPGKLATGLPAGTFRLGEGFEDPRMAAIAFCLGSYRFERYTKPKDEKSSPVLVCPQGVDHAEISRIASGAAIARDLVNIPANDMGPDELEAAARDLAATHKAKIKVISGDALLKQNFPMIHAVGRASTRAPRLIDMTWGPAKAPKVTLVGKGVVFDTGGLDLKPSAFMRLMKKDMGGSANVLGLAHMIMDAKLNLRLRVLIPAVENSVAGDAFRPGDVLPSRKGLTVEVGNTDAEGRLVLADALTYADEEKPDLIVDLATLTGAARVALGPDLPPIFSRDDKLCEDLQAAGEAENDPVWRLPLYKPYAKLLKSPVADVCNISSGGHAGAITAALFMEKFVEDAGAWLHGDIFAWRPSSDAGRPEGGEAHAIRALYHVLSARYPSGA
ncbi:leucyl aminopeptidase family protein [Tepidamorphus sp. 3E244]|uniref:leucyl aminopeptidase family protein n=1 Tax=Tepidamorphus sp. 3E244 TaxID=3385498 RepID=UPI0038FCADAE